jgi:hypothetical protein
VASSRSRSPRQATRTKDRVLRSATIARVSSGAGMWLESVHVVRARAGRMPRGRLARRARRCAGPGASGGGDLRAGAAASSVLFCSQAALPGHGVGDEPACEVAGAAGDGGIALLSCLDGSSAIADGSSDRRCGADLCRSSRAGMWEQSKRGARLPERPVPRRRAGTSEVPRCGVAPPRLGRQWWCRRRRGRFRACSFLIFGYLPERELDGSVSDAQHARLWR